MVITLLIERSEIKMKRSIFAAFLVIVMIAGFAVTGSAKTYGLNFESSYDAEMNLVTVQLYIEEPGALQACDISFAYDTAAYQYVDSEDSKVTADMVIFSGKSVLDDGLATCSLMFTEKCEEKDLDNEGNLILVSFIFKPLTDEFDIENFCMWATSYYISDTDVSSAVSPAGNVALKEGHTVLVTAPATTSKSDNKNSGNSKWYIYVIATVVAVGAVAGIAVIAIKNNQGDDEVSGEKKEEDNSDSPEK